MSAAEITDKLGLHSLRQRSWVSIQLITLVYLSNLPAFSSFRQRVLLLVRACSRGLSGLASPCRRLMARQFYDRFFLCYKLEFRLANNILHAILRLVQAPLAYYIV